MKITIYELLGLIKDGKAPKKVRYGLTEWFYDDSAKDYFEDNDNMVSLQMTYVSNSKWLNFEVEILDEEDEFIDIEELNGDYVVPNTPATENEAYIMACFLAHEMVLNDLIKNQKKIIERLSNERN